MFRTAVVFCHLYESAALHPSKFFHIMRIRTAEFVYVLVIVANGDDSHLLVGPHQCIYQGEVVVTHVLCFVDYEHSLAYPVRLNFARPYHIGSFLHHIGSVIKVPDSAEQVEAVRMESLYFNEVCSVAYQLHQSLFEFRSCSS